MKTYQESKKKTPTELLYIEVIKKAFTDAFTIGTASDQSQSLAQSQAKNWFDINNKDFKLICEHAGTEPEYIIRLKSLLHGMCLDLKHAEEVRKKLVKKIKEKK